MKTITGTLALLLLLAGFAVACNGDDDSDGTPTAPTTPSTTATASSSPTPSVEDEVEAAYLNYWDVYSDAVYNLDSSHLSQVMTGPRLDRAIDEVNDLLQQGRAVEIDVVNSPAVIQVDGSSAVLLDEYENSSRFIDPQTKEPLSSPAEPQTIRDTVTLNLIDGTWKVYDSVREAE